MNACEPSPDPPRPGVVDGAERDGEVAALRERVRSLEEELSECHRLALVGANMRGLAHSVRSTLGLCSAATHMVERALARDDRADLERAWEMVKRSSSRTAELVGGLLDPDRGLRPDLRPGDPDAVVGEVCEVALIQAEDQGDELVLELDGDLQGSSFDAQAIHRCCVELISNALDALVESPTGGRVTVRTEGAGRGWRLIVRDTGPGMTPEGLRRALRGGFSSKGGGGSGLGLGIVRELMRQHGGTVGITSSPSQGTEVCCDFPASPETATKEQRG